jgi:hypothetical protein
MRGEMRDEMRDDKKKGSGEGCVSHTCVPIAFACPFGSPFEFLRILLFLVLFAALSIYRTAPTTIADVRFCESIFVFSLVKIVCVSSDGQWVMAACADGRAHLWNLCLSGN